MTEGNEGEGVKFADEREGNGEKREKDEEEIE